MQRQFENYFLNVITGQKRGFFATVLKFFLRILSWPFRFGVACRNWIFDKGWVRRYYPPIPVVISIGNIVVGGTGKTPVTMLIAQEFCRDFVIAILSRGYRSQAEKLAMPIIVSKGEGPLQSAAFCGDEPFLLAQNLPRAIVIVGRDRHKASDIAAREGASIVLLDDGMQHRRLARDFEIVVMDMGDPFGQGFFLPRGLLREGVSSLSRASVIILNHANDREAFSEMKKRIGKYSKATVIGTRMEVAHVKHFSGEDIVSLEGKKVGIFCGIARPDYFQKTVSQLGAEVVDYAFAADHMSLDKKTLLTFAEQCKRKGAELLLCTEKDRVKTQQMEGLALPLACIKIHLKLVEGQEEWKQFISLIKTRL